MMEPTEGANPLHTPRMAVWFLTAHAPVSSATQADIQPLLAWSGRRALRLRLAASSEEWLELLPERLISPLAGEAKRIGRSVRIGSDERTRQPRLMSCDQERQWRALLAKHIGAGEADRLASNPSAVLTTRCEARTPKPEGRASGSCRMIHIHGMSPPVVVVGAVVACASAGVAARRT